MVVEAEEDVVEGAEKVGGVEGRQRTAGKCGVGESSELEDVVLDFLLSGGLSGFAGLDWPLPPPPCISPVGVCVCESE